MPITKRTRFEVLRRDEHTCRYCGAKAPDTTIEVDHVIPLALGGTDLPENLVTACSDCNAGKSSTAPDQATVEDVNETALKWQAAMRQASNQIDKQYRERQDKVGQVAAGFLHHWNEWTYGPNNEHLPLPEGWEESIHRFSELGIGHAAMAEMINIAGRNPRISPHGTFKYFCGIAWKRVREINSAAQQILSKEGN